MSILPPVWINWLAHWTSNPEVVGSNPGADAKILSVNIEFRCPLPVPLSQTLRTPGRRSLVAKRTILAGSHIRPTGLGFNYKAITSTSLLLRKRIEEGKACNYITENGSQFFTDGIVRRIDALLNDANILHH